MFCVWAFDLRNTVQAEIGMETVVGVVVNKICTLVEVVLEKAPVVAL